MCQGVSSDGRPGAIRAALAWLMGRATPPPAPAAADHIAEERAWLRRQADNMPKCERCGSLRSEDDATMHRRWCGNCDLLWLEEQICAPLVARLGRRGARRALRALVRGEIR